MTGPIRLVYYDEKGKFRMDTEAVSILQRVKGPIGVVSVCGPVQEGKSFIANQLLRRTHGFKVELTGSPPGCTKGLWLWSTPLTKTGADGTEYSIFVIDTQGFDRCKHAEQYFYLAVVLSSMLIYNQMGLINWSSFRSLSLVTKITDMTVGDFDFSPLFTWILRDFYLDMEGTSPCQYMESSLNPEVPVVASDAMHVKAPNEVRKSIKAVFPERHCFILVRPLNREKKLRVLDQISVDRLRKEFKKGMKDVRSFVFEKTKPKKIGSMVMTGPIFVQITQYILDAFNNGKRPTIASILENVEKTERESATNATQVDDSDTPPAANTRLRKRRAS